VGGVFTIRGPGYALEYTADSKGDPIFDADGNPTLDTTGLSIGNMALAIWIVVMLSFRTFLLLALTKGLYGEPTTRLSVVCVMFIFPASMMG
jgi:hypothetical protein